MVNAEPRQPGVHQVLAEIASASLSIPGAECSTIALWHETVREFEVLADIAIDDWDCQDAVGTRYSDQEWSFDLQMLKNRTPVIVERDDPLLNEFNRQKLLEFGIESLAVFPILRIDEEVGLYYLTSRRLRAFGPETLRLGQEIASQTGLAIHNARLLDSERQRANDWSILHRVSRAAVSSLDKQIVLTEVAQACLGIPGTECCTIFSLDLEADEMIVEADVAIPDWPGVVEPGTRFPLVPGAAEFKAIAHRVPIVVEADDPDLIQEDRSVMAEYGMRSIVIIPVWVSNQNTGVIYFASRALRTFDDKAIKLGMEVGTQVALALQNAALLAESRRYAEDQSALLRVSRAVATSTNLHDVMNEVALASLAIAGAQCCEIELYTPESDETETVAVQSLPLWARGTTPLGKRFQLADWPATKQVIETRTAMIVDPASDILGGKERRLLLGENENSALFVPMVLGDRCLGIVGCYAAVKNAFSEDSIRLGADLASQAAIAVERIRMHAALSEQANTDGLTGLLNHRAILERLDVEIARAERTGQMIAVLMIDLNCFKYVNDTHGHQIGDRVLKHVSQMLTSAVREYDVIGRYGGDEFLVVLPDSGIVEALDVAERIEKAASRVSELGLSEEFAFGIATGVAVFPSQAMSRQELIDIADQRMYESKRATGTLSAAANNGMNLGTGELSRRTLQRAGRPPITMPLGG
jgi:diguanylate cyclase (GGDEF)-like protein